MASYTVPGQMQEKSDLQIWGRTPGNPADIHKPCSKLP